MIQMKLVRIHKSYQRGNVYRGTLKNGDTQVVVKVLRQCSNLQVSAAYLSLTSTNSMLSQR